MVTPKTEVYWYTQKVPQIKKLIGNIATETLVIGGGMAGLSTALELVNSGREVVLVEKDFCGSGASGKSSGFITPDSELELQDFVARYGLADAKKLWSFVNSGIEQISKTISQNNINCDYQIQDSLFVANTKAAFKEVSREHHCRIESGYESTLYDREGIGAVLNSGKYFGGVRYGKTFGMNSYSYCQSLKEVLQRRGVQIYEDAAALSRDGETVTVGEFSVKAKNIVVCTDFRPFGMLNYQKQIYHAQTFLTVSKPLSAEQVKKIFPNDKLMVWDTDLIYQYYRLSGEQRLIFGASSLIYTYLPFSVQKPIGIVSKIKRYLNDKFELDDLEIDYIWPGLIGVTKDFLPVAGKIKDGNVYYIAGVAGLPWAAALGQYIAQKIVQNRDEYDMLFTSERAFPIKRNFGAKPLTFAISHGIAKYFR